MEKAKRETEKPLNLLQPFFKFKNQVFWLKCAVFSSDSLTNTDAVEIQAVMCWKDALLRWTMESMDWHSAVALAQQQS